MTHKLVRLLSAAAIGSAGLLPLAQAETITFESVSGVYMPGESFVQGAFTLTTRLDFGVIDTATALGSQSPTGNATQFYFNSNDGALDLARTDGGLFSLSSFSAAFVALDPASLQTTVIVAVGTLANNTQVTASWSFASSLTTHYPFSTYSSPASFAAFGSVKLVQFHACSLVGSAICTQPTMNNGQFAIDNIVATPVPEPAALTLMTLGLLGLGLRARRAAAR